MVVLLEGFAISTEELRSSVRVTIGFFEGLTPPITQFGRVALLRRVSVVPNFIHLIMTEATMFLGTFNAADMFLVAFPRSVSRHNPVSGLYRQFLRPHGLFFSLTGTVSTVGPCIDRYVPFQIMSSQLNFHRWTPIKL